MHPLPILLLTLTSSPLSSAFKLYYYTGEGCRGQRLGEWTGGQNEGCQKPPYPGVQSSVFVQSTGPIDDPAFTVFFNVDDCDPDSEVTNGKDGKGHMDDGCYTGEYRSLAVWDTSAQ